MAVFRKGWYEISFDPKTYNHRCRYFKTPWVYTAECVVQSNGAQVLTWADPAGPDGLGKPGDWLDSYKPLQEADQGDWWDNPPGGPNYQPNNPGGHSRRDRTPTARELCQRAATADPTAADGLSCVKEINVAVFFDGTNNNMKRDKPDQGHSNIVSLYEAHKDDKTEHFRYYIPGVGTPFPEIGEFGEDPQGKAFAAGGEARIHWAMLQVYNAVCRAATASDLMPEAEMKVLTTSIWDGLATWWRFGDGKFGDIFGDINKRLLKALEGKRPTIMRVNLSVFGFSRGAAEARVFCKWIQAASNAMIGTASLNLRFLGIYDTVASVGLADSSPIANGLGDWVDGNLAISGVGRTVHYVAAHEIRQSFPLSTARDGASWPSGVKEYIYPGAHSDIGGGYSPGDQGKATTGRSALASQIPLNDMYFEALNGGVSLFSQAEVPDEVRADFEIHPVLNSAFSAYADWTTLAEKSDAASDKGEPVENRMQYHTHLYWRWRGKVSPDAQFKAMYSYTQSKQQDKTDLWESELDWRNDVQAARKAHEPSTRLVGSRAGTRQEVVQPNPNGLQREIVRQVNAAATVPDSVGVFFDQFIHDSHAGFWLLGPQTKADKKTFIDGVKAKHKMYKQYMARADAEGNPGRAQNFRNAARGYELNNFERRVFDADANNEQFPHMTDSDAADMRDNAGFIKGAVIRVFTATRREPHGHGRYRRIFDES